MVKKLLLLFLCLLALPLIASHIFGGEFELIHVSGNRYRLNLILYFDKKNGEPGAKDGTISARIFRKSDDKLMKTVSLPLATEVPVGYTQPGCSEGEIQTNKLTYTALVDLPASDFSDPAGYYVAWERCCRNYDLINNIYSDNPNQLGNKIAAGQTFYLEFPPVVKNGQPFINSSPRNFPALNDYATTNQSYYADFAATDDDGDSLVYTLTTPLSTHTFEAYPPVLPQPYPPITWKPGYSLDAITRGNPDLRITKSGLLTVTPSGQQGLYVFAVKIEQFRNKEKIGESRRDFQLFVVDKQLSVAPKITGKKLTDASFDYDNTMNVSFANTVKDADRCIQVRVSDADSQNPVWNNTENIQIKVVGLNFSNPNLNRILPSVTTATLTNGSTREFRICFPECPFIKGPYQVGIIAMDDACSVPLMDTLRVTVNVDPVANADPYFVTPAATVYAQIAEGTKGVWNFEARDADFNPMVMSVVTDGFKLEEAGMKVTVTTQQGGLIKGQLTWDAFCNIYNFTKRSTFKVKILVDDTDKCNVNDPVAAEFNLSVLLPGNADPIVYTDLADPSSTEIKGLGRKINQSLSFNVFGSDIVDNDLVSVTMLTPGYKASDYGITFSDKTARSVVQSPFQWDLKCKAFDLSKKDVFNFVFVAIDSTNKCKLVKTDTVKVEVKVLPPDNAKPVLSISNKNPEVLFSDNQVEAMIGKQIILQLDGADTDVLPKPDSLTLELISATGDYTPEGYTFNKAAGFRSVSSTFTWNPECSIFQNEVYDNNYTFKFLLKDNKCLNAKADSATIKIKIKDVATGEERFLPPNVFTPNGDNFNDYYAMEIKDELTGALTNILPLDNCVGKFESIRIYNRWGVQVFESTDRNFKWLGKDESAGVYYYQVKYSNREYKGSVSLRY